MKRFWLLSLILLPMLPGCIDDPDPDPPGEQPDSGLFIINEGNFMADNASLSYYDIDSGKVINDVFFDTNDLPLGDVAVSMTIRDSLGYIVVNNSGRIYVINTNTFEYVGKITGLTSPRYMHFVSDQKAYVTDLYARSVAVVDPVSLEVTGNIDVSNGSVDFVQHTTERMVQVDQYIYTNCWSYDNQVLVIDTETDQVVDSIEVLKQPNSMALDKYDNLWVLTDGGWQGSPYGYEKPGLLKVDLVTKTAQVICRFTAADYPTELSVNGTGDTLYYLNRDVYRFAVEGDAEPMLFLHGPADPPGYGGFYGLMVNPGSSELYVSDAIDYMQPGVVYRVSPDGTPLDTFQVGITPGAFCFKP